MSTVERINDSVKEMLAENKQRVKLYFRSSYDPKTGDKEQEVIPRFKLELFGQTMWLPMAMKENRVVKMAETGYLQERANREGNKAEFIHSIISGLSMDRLKEDFEFWAATCAKIQDKESKRMIPFILNRGQRKLLAQYERQRLENKPIRVILVKARQWGGSTLTQIYMLWLQMHHYENWH
jgi:hypothetical protein